MKKKKIAILLVVCLLLAAAAVGCTYHFPKDQNNTQGRVVTGVLVHFSNGPLKLQRNYTDSDKMRRILHYLRYIDPYGTPSEDPEQLQGSDFHIVLSFSDGGYQVYQQRSDRFMRIDGGIWQRIDPEKAKELTFMLDQMESDA